MAGRRAKLIGLMLLALAGCDHFDALRQGVLSTYSKELRQLGEDIDRKELVKISAKDEEVTRQTEDTPAEKTGVHQIQWQAAPLSDAVQLGRPVPLSQPSNP
jgi:hypothetical protein